MTKKVQFNRRNFVAKALCTDNRFKTAVFKDKRRCTKHKVDYKDKSNW